MLPKEGPVDTDRGYDRWIQTRVAIVGVAADVDVADNNEMGSTNQWTRTGVAAVAIAVDVAADVTVASAGIADFSSYIINRLAADGS